ncbi:hypothetical protein CQA53_06685 [Helicobacter didelphidarum]|uniref:Uncharacterized protein n=1 Tax=Helicobacter didelphidarum TaxID=2040648 RepID=A0A3D8IIU2_9HELI|nr:hypothetical protein [Helicobacter didelphidarum]RDU65257.1 hypothetical protein CQA53_06685 [Helicobacter didelphidarum]
MKIKLFPSCIIFLCLLVHANTTAQDENISVPAISIPNAPTITIPSLSTPKQQETKPITPAKPTPKVTIPKPPVTTMPTIPTTQAQTTIESSKDKVLYALFNDILKNRMLLQSYCAIDGITLQSNLNQAMLKKIGMLHFLSFWQYQDNMVRLRDITFTKIPQTSYQLLKQYLENNELVNIAILIDFYIKDTKKYTILLSKNYMQINKTIVAISPQIFETFRSYFCHPHVFQNP